MTSNGGLVPGSTYTLKLGSTWDHIPADLIHAVQYDFKPASVDPSQPGQMKLEGNNEVTVSLPHKDSDECSEFKGNKQSTHKECFLFVDKKSGTVYLEKVSNMIRVKKHRSVKKKVVVRKDEERVSPVPPAAPVSPKPVLVTPSEPAKAPSDTVLETTEPQNKRLKTADNLSSDSSGSDSDTSNSDAEVVKEEVKVELGSSGVMTPGVMTPGAMITPLGQPDVKEEGGSSGDALMNMLSRDLDISSDSDLSD